MRVCFVFPCIVLLSWATADDGAQDVLTTAGTETLETESGFKANYWQSDQFVGSTRRTFPSGLSSVGNASAKLAE